MELFRKGEEEEEAWHRPLQTHELLRWRLSPPEDHETKQIWEK